MIKLLHKTGVALQSKQDYLGLLVSTLVPFTLFACVSSISKTAYSEDPVIVGKKVYERCQGCHSLTDNRTGPKHCGLFGRKAGTAQGYDYSDAMRNGKIVWDEATLDAFIKAPLQNLPGTTMGYAGVKNDNDRANLIAYLKQASHSPECKEHKQ
ncbi:MAG: cytochrome c family protein [Thiotrichaceae bacterium]